jgi:hypothetical protein
MRKGVMILLATMFVIAVRVLVVEAQCMTIGGFSTPPGPGADGYLLSTEACTFQGITLFGPTTTCMGNNALVQATFSSTLTVFQAAVMGGGWVTWSSPPFSQSPIPIVGFTNGASSLTINLLPLGESAPRVALIFGAEIEPNAFQVFPITVNYYSGLGGTGILLASITQSVDGFAGARLFAAVCPPGTLRIAPLGIRSVTITIPPEAVGFAIAQLRSDSFLTPPPLPPASGIASQPLVVVPEDATSNY